MSEKEQLEQAKRGFTLFLRHTDPRSAYGRMIGNDQWMIYDSRETFDHNIITCVGPVGVTASIAALCMELRKAITDEHVAYLCFIKGDEGSVWPSYATKYNELVISTGCSWNSGEGGRGYKEMQEVFAFLSWLYGFEVKTFIMSAETENHYMDLIRAAQQEEEGSF